MSDPTPTVEHMADKKHPECPLCDCGAPYGEHCHHAHLPWGMK